MRRWTVAVAAVAACLALYVPALHAQAPEKSKVTVGVGGKTLFYYLPLTIAEQKGYFKARTDVELRISPAARALQALLGSVDMVSGAYEHTITQQAKGQNIGRYSAGQRFIDGAVMNKAKADKYKSPADLA
jgi:NitT/TauT family transport system substrate-binding protein